MEGFFGSLTWPSAPTWSAFALNAAVAVVAQIHPHVRRAFHQWRLDRRLARDSYIQRDELREYELAIGDDLDPLEPAKVGEFALLAGTLSAVPVWLAESHLDHWLTLAWVAFLMLAFLVGIWRWFNDPEPDPEALTVLGEPLTFVSMAGAVGAVGIVALLLAAALWTF